MSNGMSEDAVNFFVGYVNLVILITIKYLII